MTESINNNNKRLLEDENDVNSNKSNKKTKSSKDLPFQQVYLDTLPNGLMYEKSYMHRDICTYVEISKSEYIITVDILGYLKFWKKQPTGIEFVRVFRVHSDLGCAGISISPSGDLLCSIGLDRNVRIFDINNFDIINSFKLPYIPLTCQWINSGPESKPLIAISSRQSPDIYIYNSKSSNKDDSNTEEVSNENSNNNAIIFDSDINIKEDDDKLLIDVVKIHKKPVHLMKFSEELNVMISTDISGIIEYWDVRAPYEEPKSVKFEYKMDTDLYDLVQNKTVAISLQISPNSNYFSVMGKDRKLRIFNYQTGKLYRVYDETFHQLNEVQKSDDPIYALDSGDFGKRMAVEREMDNFIDQYFQLIQQFSPTQKPQNTYLPSQPILFDHSSNIIIYSTLVGIKMVNMKSNKVVRVLGKIENSTRFHSMHLYQGRNEGSALLGTKKQDSEPDPTLFCLAYKKQRFYMFSRREPEESDNPDLGRDVFNEKVTKDEQLLLQNAQRVQLPRCAVIHTSRGDIHMVLFPDECPKSVENFTTHSRNGYYDGVIFHRVIKGFVIQTGDPMGDGTGGTSIWNREFEDEINRSLRHDRPFTLSMANAGPNTNGSQFFITTSALPRLDNKHTVFGRVYKGMETVLDIEKTKTDSDDKPLDPISIVNIKIHQDVPLEFASLLKKK